MKTTNLITIIIILNFELFLLFQNQFIVKETSLVLSLVIISCVAFFKVNKVKNKLLLNKKKYFFYFLIPIILSSLIPYYEFNQSISSTLLATRHCLALLFLLLLFHIQPSENEIIRALRKVAIATYFFVYTSIFFPALFLSDEKYNSFLARTTFYDSTDLVTATYGAHFLFLFFCIQCSKLINSFSKTSLGYVILTFITLILIQNRSALIIAIPIFVYTILRINSKNKMLIRMLIRFTLISYAAVLFFIFSNIFSQLYNETFIDVSNSEYSRLKTLNFIVESDYSFLNVMLGHGYPSANGVYLKQLLTMSYEENIFLSDVGLFSNFYFFGAFFMIIFYYIIIKNFKRRVPIYMKFFSLYVIFVPTIHGFINNKSSIILFSLFIYLTFLHNTKRIGSINYRSKLQY